jgi:hypothetical protein
VLILLIVVAVIVVLALLIGLGSFGHGPYEGPYEGPGEPTIYRRIIHRRPSQRRVIYRR